MIEFSEMRRHLSRTPWWDQPRTWILRDPDLRRARNASFDYTPRALDDLESGSLYLLRGPRRVGKTVTVKKAIHSLVASGTNPRLVLHMATDHLAARDLRTMVDAAAGLTPPGRRTWFIDEITAVKDGWPAAIKWLRDNDPRFAQDTVVLTGSSASDLGESVKALAGRRGDASDADRTLLPMSFRAFLRVVGDQRLPDAELPPMAVDALTPEALADATLALAPHLETLVRAWHVYMTVGGFPRVVDSHVRGRSDDAFRRDLLDVVHGEALRQARWSKSQTDAFVRRLAKGLGSPTNRADIANYMGGSATLVGRRLDALRDGFVVWPCYRETFLRPKLAAQEKFYFVDPVFTRLTRHPEAAPNAGVLSEQQLGTALVRSFARRRPGGFLDFDSVLHHRTPTRKEIDFVGPDFGDVAIESKYVPGNRWRRAVPTLKASRWRGIVATRDALDVSDPELVAVPTGMLAWLIGG